MKSTFPLHIHILTLFLLIILFACTLIGGVGFKFSREMLETAAADLTGRVGQKTVEQIDALVAPAEMAINLVRHAPLGVSNTPPRLMAQLPFLKAALDGSSALSSIYIGYANGDFFLLRRLDADAERAAFAAPVGTRYIVQSIAREGGAPRGRYVFLDGELASLGEVDRPDYGAGFDPREREWYEKALVSAAPVKTAPYLFFSNRKVGMTLAARTPGSDAVVGADILLDTLSDELERQKATPGTEIVLVDAGESVIASSTGLPIATVPETPDAPPVLRRLAQTGSPVLAAAAKIFAKVPADETNAPIALADDTWHIHFSPVPMRGLAPLHLVIAVPDHELLTAAMKIRTTSVWITMAIVLLTIPLVWYAARAISGPLRALARDTEAIRRFDFATPTAIRSRVREVVELAETVDGMRRTIRRFRDISRVVAAEPDFDRLLPMLLKETRIAADADAGVLYLVDGETLVPASIACGGQDTVAPELPPLTLGHAGPLLDAAVAADGPLVVELTEADIAAMEVDALLAGLIAPHAVAIPLRNRGRDLVGALLLFCRRPIGAAQVSFVNALSGAATSSIETRELIKAQKTLFEAFIQLIARAIDAKSPYTGGHCARVPVLAKMLAQAACDEKAGPFAGFTLDTNAWEALHVAAWLHDCGKITTPEYVIDKATKLETIADRIHEVRMRFEVLKRDAEIACLKAISAGEDALAAEARLKRQWAQIDDDFAFVVACNQGGEVIAAERIARLNAIACRTWTCTLDDRLGISRDERERKARTPAPPLPVAESLLADRPDQRFERLPEQGLPVDNPWGFRMKAPELLYDRGELHNLAVARGTLSAEDRYKINEHMIQTVIMLSQLPFPKHLRSVPEIACGHHEKMDGTGFPKRLTGDEMSLQARMMAIADIFEALTAVDRPYKTGKTLSEAIRIMASMVENRHIDPDLFALFLRAGVYRAYAERYLRPEQIDAVDIQSILDPAHPAGIPV